MRLLVAPAMFLLVCLVSAGVTGSASSARTLADPGVTATSIHLGSVIDQTGRGTVISLHILAGYRLALDEINAHGGINGRKIDLKALSDNYDPSQTLPQLKQLVESDNVFALLGVFGSDDVRVAAPYVEQKHVPFFDPVGGGVDITGKQWMWQTEPDYGREGRVMAKYLATSLHAKRVAVLYQVGIGESQRDAIKKALAKYGATMVADASYASTDTNLNGQVLRFRGANPDVVVLNGTPLPTAAFMQSAAILHFKPKEGFMANYPMGDPLWLALIGSTGEGNRISSYADLTGKNRTAIAYKKAIAKYHGESYSNYGLYGYFNATLFFKALKLAGKQLTRSGLQKALDSDFRHYDTGFAGKINWTATSRYGARQFKIYQIHSGKLAPITGWLSP